MEDFASTSFPANLIERARYCLMQIELAEHGAHAEFAVLGGEDVHVEHIIPQKIKSHAAKDEFGDWVKYLGAASEAKHSRYIARIGNMTLFAGALNIGASNNPFLRKKKAYKESGIKLTQALCNYPVLSLHRSRSALKNWHQWRSVSGRFHRSIAHNICNSSRSRGWRVTGTLHF
jgi:hypothetical protein